MEMETETELAVIKADVAAIKDGMAQLRADRADIRADLAQFKAETRADLSQFRADVRADLADFRKSVVEMIDAKIRGEMHRELNAQTWRIILMLSFVVAVTVAIAKLFP